MALFRFSIPAFILLLSACNSHDASKAAKSDSCATAIPFENAEIVESMISPGYTGELKNYMGEDTTKLDFRHRFENGKIVNSIFYYDNGNVQEEYHIKCGSMHGIVKRFYENGVLAQTIPYRYGRLEGIGEEFDQKGMLRIQVVFTADSAISQKIFDSTGREIPD